MPRPAAVSKSVHVYDAEALQWQSAGKTGLALKPVREDRDNGRFLGLVAFEPVTRSGLHQHLGVATSFILDGGLTDYQGAIELHEAGINLKGATHDAVFNAIIIPMLIPLALKGVSYKPIGASALLRRNLLLYGLGGVLIPFVGIKLIDLVVTIFI